MWYAGTATGLRPSPVRTRRIREVVAKCILFSGMDFREREVIVDAMEEKSFGAVRSC